jgi:hypothetical protein
LVKADNSISKYYEYFHRIKLKPLIDSILKIIEKKINHEENHARFFSIGKTIQGKKPGIEAIKHKSTCLIKRNKNNVEMNFKIILVFS